MSKTSLLRCHNIYDLRKLARKKLPRSVFDYIDGAADDEVSLNRNMTGFDNYHLLPRTLVDVSSVDLTTTILGQEIELPIIMAPTGMSRLFHYQGEAAVSRSASRAGTIYSLSSMATMSIEEVAATSTGPKCFQIYVWKDRELLRDFIQRCKKAGYSALCLTVDLPTAGKRERDLRNGFVVPPRITPATVLNAIRHPEWLWYFLTKPRISLGNIREHTGAMTELFSVIEYTSSQFDPSMTWEDAEWMIKEWNGPFAIKGVMHSEDARRALDIGATAVIVSNHGGRQLDQVPGCIEVLPEIVNAVGDSIEVILDGGIRRGTDVVKALALGAKACMVGRAYLYGLASGGEEGVDRALEILTEEVKRALMLLGCSSVKDLDGRFVERRS